MARAMQNEYHPDVVSPSGETLLETLKQIGMTQMELAARTGRPMKTVNEIIKGKAAITPETALQLERVLGIPARFWSNHERGYRENLVQRREAELLAQEPDWMNEVPVKELVRLGWIRQYADRVEQARAVLNFYGAATPAAWKELYCRARVAYRVSPVMEGHPAAAVAWLRKGELNARNIDCERYAERTFRAMLLRLRELTINYDPHIVAPELQRLCVECGVAFVFVPEIRGKQVARLLGAARWITSDKALIQLNARLREDGDLWFTLYHEAAHILLHGKRTVFVDDQSGDGSDSRESQADEFARNLMVRQVAYGDTRRAAGRCSLAGAGENPA